jgi:hypothetical protein
MFPLSKNGKLCFHFPKTVNYICVLRVRRVVGGSESCRGEDAPTRTHQDRAEIRLVQFVAMSRNWESRFGNNNLTLTCFRSGCLDRVAGGRFATKMLVRGGEIERVFHLRNSLSDSIEQKRVQDDRYRDDDYHSSVV